MTRLTSRRVCVAQLKRPTSSFSHHPLPFRAAVRLRRALTDCPVRLDESGRGSDLEVSERALP